MPLIEFISRRLQELRKKHGLTQEQMADLLETDWKWYQRVEWCKKDIRASTIDRLAAVFGVTAEEFLGKDLPKTKVVDCPPGSPHKNAGKQSATGKVVGITGREGKRRKRA